MLEHKIHELEELEKEGLHNPGSWVDSLDPKEKLLTLRDRKESSWIAEVPSNLKGIEVFKHIVETLCIHRFVDKAEDVNLGIDITTAGIVCQVYDALSEKNKTRFGSMWPLQMIDIAFQVIA